MEEITLEQALEAEKFVDNYIYSMGGDPDEIDYVPQPHWSQEAKDAWEIANKFWTDMEEKGMLP